MLVPPLITKGNSGKGISAGPSAPIKMLLGNRPDHVITIRPGGNIVENQRNDHGKISNISDLKI